MFSNRDFRLVSLVAANMKLQGVDYQIAENVLRVTLDAFRVEELVRAEAEREHRTKEEARILLANVLRTTFRDTAPPAIVGDASDDEYGSIPAEYRSTKVKRRSGIPNPM
jgi:hypothetical protein